MGTEGKRGSARLTGDPEVDVALVTSPYPGPLSRGGSAGSGGEGVERTSPAGSGITRRALWRTGVAATLVLAGRGSLPALAAETASDLSAQSARQGDEIARTALKYKGTRYVWGGNTPKGFDCSGFTQYVVKQVLRIDIGPTVTGQWRFGDRVAKRKLRAGDLVFFANTFERGLSHVGIFLGNGRFIHAENERTGVVISDLDSDYYSAHYHGARRLT